MAYKDPEYPKKYYEANKEHLKKRVRAWREANPHRLRKYGLTKEAWENIFESQGRVCYLCGIDSPGSRGTWQTDHSHDNGKVRSILCWPCNVGLGMFKDNSVVLRKAADYVEYHA